MYLRWQRNWTQIDQAQQMLNEWKKEEKRLVTKLAVIQQQQG
jgi:hypothetical protein